jgi:long-chain acyl-CoA synthetase
MTAPGLGFWKLAQEEPQHIAIVEAASGREITAGELLAGCNQVVHGLRALGLERGDTIAAALKNESAVLELYLAATQAGLYFTPINSHLTTSEIAHILADSDAKAFFCCDATGEASAKAAAEVSFPENARFATTGKVPGFRPYAELKAGQPTTLPEDRKAGAPMTYTSGTTGRPKGVRRPLADYEPEVVAGPLAQFLMLFGITPRDNGVHLVVSPLYHTAVLSFASNHLHMGHTLVIMEKWTPEAMLELIDRYQVTTSHMVPTQFIRLLKLPEAVRAKFKGTSMRHMIHGAAPCPVETKHTMLKWWGPVVYEYYSASEGGGTTATPTDWLAHPGTVGKAWPISQIKILRDDDSDADVGEVGTVFISMGTHKFEYFKDQEKTKKSWRGSFFTVGDAGYLDKDGFLYLCDRKSDMIISGGVNIYPAEIESVLVGHPKVGDVAVFGIPDEDWGEQVKAVIEPAAGTEPTDALAQEILAFCKEHLASFKVPKTVDFLAQLPRDPNGKLYKRKLRDPYWAGRDKAI